MKIIGRQAVSFLLFLWIFSTISFLLINLAPGDPASTILRAEDVAVTQQQLNEVRQELGMNDSIFKQYTAWLGSFLLLDWGTSYVTQESAFMMIMRALPATIYISAGAFLTAAVIAVPIGTAAALYRGSWIDKSARLLAVTGASVPSFLIGLVLIQLFAVQLGWLPAIGAGTWWHLLLPSLTLGIGMASFYIRLIRSSFLEALEEPSLRAVAARGISEQKLRWKYTFRAALVPVISVLGVSISSLIGGTVVIEVVFGYPGAGSLIVDSITRRDIPVIQGYTVLMAAAVSLIQLSSDLLLRRIAPNRGTEGRVF